MKASSRVIGVLIGGLFYLTAAVMLTPLISERVCQWTALTSIEATSIVGFTLVLAPAFVMVVWGFVLYQRGYFD
jgi:hypothetical protein